MLSTPTAEEVRAKKIALEIDVALLREKLKELEERLDRLTVTCEVIENWPGSLSARGKPGSRKGIPVREMLMDVMRSLPNDGFKSDDVRMTAERRFKTTISPGSASYAFGRLRNLGVLEIRKRRWFLVDTHQDRWG